MACAVRSFSIPTDAAGATHTINDLGFDPDFLIITVSGRTDSIDAVGVADVMTSIGLADSGGTRRVVATQFENEADTTSCDSAADDDCVVQAISTAGASIGKLDVDAWVSGGVRFIVDEEFSSGYRAHVLFLSGITPTYTTWTNPAATGETDITGLGDDLEAVLFLGVGHASTFPNLAARGGVCFGAAADLGGSIVNAILITHARDAVATPTGAGNCRIGTVCIATNLAGNINVAGSVTALVTDGVTVNLTAAAEQRRFYVVGLKGIDVRIASLATKTDTTTTFGSGALSFTPRGGLVLSRGKAENASATLSVDADGSIGMWDEEGSAVCQAWAYDDGSDPSVGGTAVDHDELYVNLANDGSTVEGKATFSASDSDSVDFIMTDADPSSFFAWGLIFGGAAIETESEVVGNPQFWRWRN